MNIDLRLPDISGTDAQQLAKIRSYLYQFIPQLQWALSNIDSIGASNTQAVSQTANSNVATSAPSNASAESTFNSIKSLIIKSAEIVDAFYEETNRRLKSGYLAESDFGTYVNTIFKDLSESSAGTTQKFLDLQAITDKKLDLDSLNASLDEALSGIEGGLDELMAAVDVGENAVVIGVEAAIKTGLLDYDNGVPVYGIEIGQSVDANGAISIKYARFTSDRLTFFDSNGNDVAYISDRKLFIRTAEITVALQIGKFVNLVMDNGDVIEKWIGG